MPPTSSHDRDSIGVKWTVHDDNDDQMVYSVYYRGDGETRWLLLKDNLTDKFYSFDASLASRWRLQRHDCRIGCSVAFARRRFERPAEPRFEVDTTPPRIENLSATLESGKFTLPPARSMAFLQLSAPNILSMLETGNTSSLAGQLDARTEAYDFTVTPETANNAASEHVIVVRAYDRYDNMGAANCIYGK